MNIFDQCDVNILKIINAEKICQVVGYDRFVSEYRDLYGNHAQGFYTIALVADGESEYKFSSTTIRSAKNSIIFLDNYSPFHQKTIEDYYVYAINFVAQSGFINRPNIFTPTNVEKYTSMFKEAASTFQHRKPGYTLMTTSILYKILSTIKADDQKQGYPISKMDKIVFSTDYINQNLSNSQLSVEMLAEKLNISSTYLRKIFIEITGLTPLKYIKNLRINRASDILSTNDTSIANVAIECGFQDVSYFCKEFKKTIGCSPLTFKRKHHTTVTKG